VKPDPKGKGRDKDKGGGKGEEVRCPNIPGFKYCFNIYRYGKCTSEKCKHKEMHAESDKKTVDKKHQEYLKSDEGKEATRIAKEKGKAGKGKGKGKGKKGKGKSE
jgi:hypothetical protein